MHIIPLSWSLTWNIPLLVILVCHCRHYSSAEGQPHVAASIKAGTINVALMPHMLGDAEIDPRDSVIDLSFRHIGLEGIPDLLHLLDQRESTNSQVSVTAVQHGSSAGSKTDAAAIVADRTQQLEMSLRECSLGDAGIAALVRSPWVCGSRGIKILSLRHNQVIGED